MNVTREVIMDLFPVYLAGEASPDTRLLMEEFLKQDPELSQRMRSQWMENMGKAGVSALPPELELTALRRTKGLLSRQKWLLAFAMFFTALPFSFVFQAEGFEKPGLYFLHGNNPLGLWLPLALGAAFWIAYFTLRRRLRTTAP